MVTPADLLRAEAPSRAGRAEGQLLPHDVGAVVGSDGFGQLPRVHVVSTRHLKAKQVLQRCHRLLPLEGSRGTGMGQEAWSAGQSVSDCKTERQPPPDLAALPPGLWRRSRMPM